MSYHHIHEVKCANYNPFHWGLREGQCQKPLLSNLAQEVFWQICLTFHWTEMNFCPMISSVAIQCTVGNSEASVSLLCSALQSFADSEFYWFLRSFSERISKGNISLMLAIFPIHVNILNSFLTWRKLYLMNN